MAKSFAAILFFALSAGIAAAGERPEQDVRERVAERFRDVDASQVFSAPIPGFVEVRHGGEVVYVSRDGETMLRGDIIRLSSGENLTEERRAELRKAMLAEIPSRQSIVFRGEKVETTITVFTDIDCGYCRKLHRGVGRLNGNGIAVRYLFYPRSGPGTASWRKAEHVWCSEDSRDALTRAKAGEPVTATGCGSTPVEEHYRLGRAVGVSGTPTIVTESGELIRGYMPPDRLIEKIRQLEGA